MKVYCYDTNGFYIGDDTADESPLEPGVYLIPGHSTEVKPPATTAGHWPCWNGEKWGLVDVRPKPPAPITREQVQLNRLRAYANAETGSDRFMIEALAMRAHGDVESAEIAEVACLARRTEIAAENPWPVEAKSK